jgi:hypothetical protein
MKKSIIFTAGILTIITLLTVVSFAQPPRNGKSPVEIMDTDGDSKISNAEWTAFHAKMFKEMDKNGDGYLSDNELRPSRPVMDEEE